MLRSISSWEDTGNGGKSTLEKEELKSRKEKILEWIQKEEEYYE